MHRRDLFRALHVLWALTGLALSVVLGTSTGGHPPAIVLLPLALAIWLLGHALLWGAHALLRRGAARSGGGPGRWPATVVVAVLGCTLVSFLGLLLLGLVILGPGRPAAPTLLTLTAALAHLPALVGLILRAGWGRLYMVAVAAGWALVTLHQMLDTLRRGSRVPPWEWPAALLVLVACALLAAAFVAGPATRRYFSDPERSSLGDRGGVG